MPTSFTTNLRLSNPGLGDTGWGATVSNGMIDLTDQAIAGQASVDVSGAGPFILTMPDGTSGDARNMFLRFTGTPGGAREVQVPTNRKLYFVTNDSDGAVTVKVSGQTGVVVPVGASMALRINAAGTDVAQALTHLSGAPTAPTAAYGTNTTQLATTAFVQAALQALHPVGSIYINATNSTNPATLFGFGTWAAFGAGRVPVGFDSGNALFDSAEETGGSANAIVVSHDHTYSATTGNQSADHTHTFSATTGLESANHTHSGTTDTAGSHSHTIPGGYIQNSAGVTGPFSGNNYATGSATDAAGVHSHTFTTGGVSANHNHSVSGTTSTVSANHNHSVSGTTAASGSSGTNANYQPYITVYMWKRTA